MNVEKIQELASCFIPSPFIKQSAALIFEKARLWCQFHFIRRCISYKEIPRDPLFNLLLSSFSNSNKICMQRNLRNSVVLI